MKREEAFKLLKKELKNDRLIKHSLAVEACMRELAKKFNAAEELWGLTGLLHDIDYEKTKDDASKHGILGAELLESMGVDDKIVYAIKAHPGHFERKSKLDIALYAVDPITGLIVASALMHPSKKLEALDKEFVIHRFKEKRFAAGANRAQIMECKKLGIELDEFIEICLTAMKKISSQLGL